MSCVPIVLYVYFHYFIGIGNPVHQIRLYYDILTLHLSLARQLWLPCSSSKCKCLTFSLGMRDKHPPKQKNGIVDVGVPFCTFTSFFLGIDRVDSYIGELEFNKVETIIQGTQKQIYRYTLVTTNWGYKLQPYSNWDLSTGKHNPSRISRSNKCGQQNPRNQTGIPVPLFHPNHMLKIFKNPQEEIHP